MKIHKLHIFSFVLALVATMIVITSPVHAAETTGTLDTHFPSTGTGFTTAGCLAYAASLQSDGKIVVAGNCTHFNGVTAGTLYRLNMDGTLDTAFATNEGTGFNNRIYGTGIQSDGKIVVTGAFTSFNGTSVTRIARLNSDGTLDTSFNSGGAGFDGDTRGLALRSNGKILVAGTFTHYNGTSANHIVQLNSDGTIDSGFVYGTGLGTSYSSLALQPDGKVLVGCAGCTSYNGTTIATSIARLNTNGTLDTTFNTNAGTGFTGSLGPWFFTIQSDNKILVTGDISGFNGHSDGYGIYRLNSDGSYDSTFNVEGTGYNSYVYQAFLQNDGKIIVPGHYTQLNGVAKGYISRLNSDGTVDSTFNSGGAGFSDQTEQVMYDARGAVLVMGYPINYNGSALPSSSIARLYTPDATAPVVTPVSISSTNAVATGATTGDTITLTFTSDDPLIMSGATPTTVTYNGVSKTVTCSGSGSGSRACTVSFTAGSGDPEGGSFVITTASDGGTTTTTATTDGTSVYFDKTAPVLATSIASSYVNHALAYPGDTITVTYTSTDPLITNTASINGTSVTPTCSGTRPNITCRASFVTSTAFAPGATATFALSTTSVGGATAKSTADDGSSVSRPADPAHSSAGTVTAPVTTISSNGKTTATTNTTTGSSGSTSGTRTLKLGMTGEDVRTLQVFLNTHGFPIVKTGGKETTYFGSATKKAVMAFQKAQGLKADGIVGSEVRKIIAGTK